MTLIWGVILLVVGIMGLAVSIRCLFASKETLIRFAPFIGTSNPFAAQLIGDATLFQGCHGHARLLFACPCPAGQDPRSACRRKGLRPPTLVTPPPARTPTTTDAHPPTPVPLVRHVLPVAAWRDDVRESSGRDLKRELPLRISSASTTTRKPYPLLFLWSRSRSATVLADTTPPLMTRPTPPVRAIGSFTWSWPNIST